MVDLGPPLRHARLHLRRVVGALVPKPLGVAGQRVGEIAQGLAAIAPQDDARAGGAAELLGDDVEMNQRDAVGDEGESAGRDLAELAARDEQAVGVRNQLVCNSIVAAEQPRRERMRARDRALAGHGMRDGERLRFGERGQRCARPLK